MDPIFRDVLTAGCTVVFYVTTDVEASRSRLLCVCIGGAHCTAAEGEEGEGGEGGGRALVVARYSDSLSDSSSPVARGVFAADLGGSRGCATRVDGGEIFRSGFPSDAAGGLRSAAAPTASISTDPGLWARRDTLRSAFCEINDDRARSRSLLALLCRDNGFMKWLPVASLSKSTDPGL